LHAIPLRLPDGFKRLKPSLPQKAPQSQSATNFLFVLNMKKRPFVRNKAQKKQKTA
jgi:hypothetical protein